METKFIKKKTIFFKMIEEFQTLKRNDSRISKESTPRLMRTKTNSALSETLMLKAKYRNKMSQIAKKNSEFKKSKTGKLSEFKNEINVYKNLKFDLLNKAEIHEVYIIL